METPPHLDSRPHPPFAVGVPLACVLETADLGQQELFEASSLPGARNLTGINCCVNGSAQLAAQPGTREKQCLNA